MLSSSVPSSEPCTAAPWPVPWTTTCRSRSAAYSTAPTTSSTVVGSTTTAGRRSAARFQDMAGVVPAAVIGEDVLVMCCRRSWRAPRDGLLKCPEPRTARSAGRGGFPHLRGTARPSISRRPVAGRVGSTARRGGGTGRRSRTARRGSRGSTDAAHRARRRSRPSPVPRPCLLVDHRRLAPGAVLGEPRDPEQMGAREAVACRRRPAAATSVTQPVSSHAAVLGVVAAAVAALRHDLPSPAPPCVTLYEG